MASLTFHVNTMHGTATSVALSVAQTHADLYERCAKAVGGSPPFRLLSGGRVIEHNDQPLSSNFFFVFFFFVSRELLFFYLFPFAASFGDKCNTIQAFLVPLSASSLSMSKSAPAPPAPQVAPESQPVKVWRRRIVVGRCAVGVAADLPSIFHFFACSRVLDFLWRRMPSISHSSHCVV